MRRALVWGLALGLCACEPSSPVPAPPPEVPVPQVEVAAQPDPPPSLGGAPAADPEVLTELKVASDAALARYRGFLEAQEGKQLADDELEARWRETVTQLKAVRARYDEAFVPYNAYLDTLAVDAQPAPSAWDPAFERLQAIGAAVVHLYKVGRLDWDD
ncbi:MAG: hypothetical protein R3F62_06625 [Planctomycetota bacterium]